MRVKPLFCIIVIVSSIVVFYYFTIRKDIQKQYATSTKINIQDNLNFNTKQPPVKITPTDWVSLKTKINYSNQDRVIRTLNDKIINSKKFNSFLYNFLDKSISAKEIILSQGESFSIDFNSTLFLSTLYYTKYVSEDHYLITKGKEKKNAIILQIAIQKALTKFYENSEGSILAIHEVNDIFNKIRLFENKSTELKNRILNLKGSGYNLDQISTNSEITILEQELKQLISTLEKISKSEKEDSFEKSLEIPYLKNFGKIQDYNQLLKQINELISGKKSTPISEEIKKNKSKLSLLLKEEYDKCIRNLNEQILESKNKISSLRNKQLTLANQKTDINNNTSDTRLLEKVSLSLNKLKTEYYDNLTFWNNNKIHISFDSTKFEKLEN
ncbi:hypothetical protein N8920_00465 [Opitutales bacterium]|nr:hypothetical protein [Opitutales bacterium]